MAFLTPDSTRTEHGLVIKQKLIPDGSHLKPNRPLLHGSVEYITIHNTADIKEAPGTNDAEQYARATLNGNMKNVAVHYYIDETDCWQLLRENEAGWHAADGNTGPGNGTSLAIEIIMDGSGSKADRGAEDRGALLAAILLHRHGLTIDKLKTHKDWYRRKNCPLYILPHWQTFVGKVSAYLSQIGAPKKTIDQIAREVIAGAWGVWPEREKRLTAAGYDYKKVQARVDELMAAINVLLGDADGNGKIEPADARLALRAALGLQTLTEAQKKAADADGNGKIEPADARLILRKALGLEG